MPLTMLKDLRKIYSALNTDEIRGAAHQDVKVGLMASSEAGYRELESLLAPVGLDSNAANTALRATSRVDGTGHDRFDFVLCEAGLPVPPNGYTVNALNPKPLLEKIAREHHEVETALARVFVPFRKPVAGQLTTRVARENALFAIVTALPNVVPSVVELPWAIGEFATDTAFLTMNQVRLALTLAAANDRPVGYMEQKAEIGAIVAGAFGWRALARELVGKIPLGGGLIPKAAIAFAGTYVVGVGLDKLHQTGKGFSKSERRDAYVDAYARGKEVASELAPSIHRS